MTLCSECFKDRTSGSMTKDGFVCGSCDPRGSVAMRGDMGRGFYRGRQ